MAVPMTAHASLAQDSSTPADAIITLAEAIDPGVDDQYGNPQYTISGPDEVWLQQGQGLTRIFHTDLLRKPGSPMDAVLDSNCDRDSMYSYSPDQNPSSALPHQPSRLPRHDQYEISGLTIYVSNPGSYFKVGYFMPTGSDTQPFISCDLPLFQGVGVLNRK